jgi:hypothetical protein
VAASVSACGNTASPRLITPEAVRAALARQGVHARIRRPPKREGNTYVGNAAEYWRRLVDDPSVIAAVSDSSTAQSTRSTPLFPGMVDVFLFRDVSHARVYAAAHAGDPYKPVVRSNAVARIDAAGYDVIGTRLASQVANLRAALVRAMNSIPAKRG